MLELDRHAVRDRRGSRLKELLAEVAETARRRRRTGERTQHRLPGRAVAPLRLPAAGLHGVERRKASGAIQGASYVDAQLDAARAALAAFVERIRAPCSRTRIGASPCTFAWRPRSNRGVRQAVAAAAKPMGTNYHIQEGKMVLEIKPRGFTKAPRSRHSCASRRSRADSRCSSATISPIEDGFRAVEVIGGISIAVGDRIKAQWRFEDPAAVRRWLGRIAALTDAHRA